MGFVSAETTQPLVGETPGPPASLRTSLCPAVPWHMSFMAQVTKGDKAWQHCGCVASRSRTWKLTVTISAAGRRDSVSPEPLCPAGTPDVTHAPKGAFSFQVLIKSAFSCMGACFIN